MVTRLGILTIWAGVAFSQTLVNGGRTIRGPWDASGSPQTAPNRVGGADPATCDASKRETFFNSTSNTLKICTATDTWTPLSAGLSDPGANGMVKRTAAGATAVATGGTDYVRPSDSITGTAAGITGKTTPAGALLGDTDSQTIANKILNNTNSLSGYLESSDIATPTSPAAGKTRHYSKAGKLCSLDSSGNEFCTGPGGITGSGVNGRIALWNGASTLTSTSMFGYSGATLTWGDASAPTAIVVNGAGASTTAQLRYQYVGADKFNLYYSNGNGAFFFHNYIKGVPFLMALEATSRVGIGQTAPTPVSTLGIQDATATTGATRVIVQAGQGQSTTNLFEVQGYNATHGSGTVLAKVASDGQAVLQSLQLNSTSVARPTCSAGIRGTFWYSAGAAGVKDAVEVCGKDASDAYAWRTIY